MLDMHDQWSMHIWLPDVLLKGSERGNSVICSVDSVIEAVKT